jgi:hypothetical protein
MPKPTELPRWADDETNNTEPSSGQKDTGWVANQVAVSSYFNWWQFLVYQWLTWINEPNTITLSAHGGVSTVTPTVEDLRISLGSAGSYHRSIPLEETQRLRSFAWTADGDSSKDWTEVIIRRITALGVGSTLAIMTSPDSRITDVATVQTSLVDFTATTGAITIDAVVNGSGHADFTRTTGSYITDGFAVGMTVTVSGYADTENNAVGTITTLTDTVLAMELGAGIGSTEAGTGDETIAVSSIPTVGVGEAFSVEFTCVTASPYIGNIRIERDGGE